MISCLCDWLLTLFGLREWFEDWLSVCVCVCFELERWIKCVNCVTIIIAELTEHRQHSTANIRQLSENFFFARMASESKEDTQKKSKFNTKFKNGLKKLSRKNSKKVTSTNQLLSTSITFKLITIGHRQRHSHWANRNKEATRQFPQKKEDGASQATKTQTIWIHVSIKDITTTRVMGWIRVRPRWSEVARLPRDRILEWNCQTQFFSQWHTDSIHSESARNDSIQCEAARNRKTLQNLFKISLSKPSRWHLNKQRNEQRKITLFAQGWCEFIWRFYIRTGSLWTSNFLGWWYLTYIIRIFAQIFFFCF